MILKSTVLPNSSLVEINTKYTKIPFLIINKKSFAENFRKTLL
jgi:hypothetical protein